MCWSPLLRTATASPGPSPRLSGPAQNGPGSAYPTNIGVGRRRSSPSPWKERWCARPVLLLSTLYVGDLHRFPVSPYTGGALPLRWTPIRLDRADKNGPGSASSTAMEGARWRLLHWNGAASMCPACFRWATHAKAPPALPRRGAVGVRRFRARACPPAGRPGGTARPRPRGQRRAGPKGRRRGGEWGRCHTRIMHPDPAKRVDAWREMFRDGGGAATEATQLPARCAGGLAVASASR